MRNAGLEEAQAGIKIAGRNINNLRYADDSTLTAESEEELKRLLMTVEEESKSPPTRRGPPRGTPRVPAPLPLSPFSPPDRDRRGDSPAWSGRGTLSLSHRVHKTVLYISVSFAVSYAGLLLPSF